jgi:hypothetical protein
MTKLKEMKKSKPLEYQVNIVFDVRDHLYVARVPELENCHSHGSSPEEAAKFHQSGATQFQMKGAT